MIVLDTNVLSELISPRPDPSVVEWFRYLPNGAAYTTTITEAEMLYGAARLPSGRRKDDLEAVLKKLFAVRFAGRVLPFDGPAAKVFGEIVVRRERAGRRYAYPDALIAAIALSSGGAIATRDVSGFDFAGIDIINPWTD